jgi:hypothetical protein
MLKHQNNGVNMKDQLNIKKFNVKLPYELWIFLKKSAVDQDVSMNKIIIDLITKLKNSKKRIDINN